MNRSNKPEISYLKSDDFRWTERAYELLQEGRLTGVVRSREGVVSSRVQGACPRCEHNLDDAQVLKALVDIGPHRGWRRPSPATPVDTFVPVDVTCSCRVVHESAPEGQIGCGISFRVEIMFTD